MGAGSVQTVVGARLSVGEQRQCVRCLGTFRCCGGGRPPVLHLMRLHDDEVSVSAEVAGIACHADVDGRVIGQVLSLTGRADRRR